VKLTSTLAYCACAYVSYCYSSLCRQRRLYHQRSGGWVSWEQAPSHLLPSHPSALNRNQIHKWYNHDPYEPINPTRTMRVLTSNDNELPKQRDCAVPKPGLLLPARPDSRRCGALQSNNKQTKTMQSAKSQRSEYGSVPRVSKQERNT
jgi:hypothetical protein